MFLLSLSPRTYLQFQKEFLSLENSSASGNMLILLELVDDLSLTSSVSMSFLFSCALLLTIGFQAPKVQHQTQKVSNERLFILTRTYSMQIFGEIPFIKPQKTLKQQINGQKDEKRLVLL